MSDNLYFELHITGNPDDSTQNRCDFTTADMRVTFDGITHPDLGFSYELGKEHVLHLVQLIYSI